MLTIVGLMVGISELTGEKEIIFPEIAALAIGYMISPRRLWAVSPKRMLLYLSGCAVAGLLIVRCLSLPVWIELSIAFVIAQVLYTFGGTSLAPFVSAICLPVLLQTETIVYPIAAFVLSLSVIIGRAICIKTGLRKQEPFIPVSAPDSPQQYLFILLRIIAAVIAIFIALRLNARLAVAPPLLVAFTEFSRVRKWEKNPDNEIRSVKHPIKTVAILTTTAAIGAYIRFGITICLHLPLTLSALVAVTIMLFLIHKTRIFMPPAGALTLLAVLIPEENVLVFPLYILAGSAYFVAVAVMIDKIQRAAIQNSTTN